MIDSPTPPVARKLAALGVPVAETDIAGWYADAYAGWLAELTAVRIAGVVADYDGTVCPTGAGHAPPPLPVQDALTRLLAGGCLLGIASGRGRSLHRELREWIPRRHWEQVLVGMYSGGVRIRLAEELPARGEIPRPDLTPVDRAALNEAHRRLAHPDLAGLLTVDRRFGQVTVKPHPRRPLPPTALAALTVSVLRRADAPAVHLAMSGYAVDVFPPAVTKAAVVAAVGSQSGGGTVLAIGDQGQPGGNDHDLLASISGSLSVDRCSADPSRCWNTAPAGASGPAALLGYLDALRPAPGGGLRFEPGYSRS